MSTYPIAIKSFGEYAILIEWPNRVEESILDDILQFTHHLKNNCLDTIEAWELVPAYNSLTLISLKDPLDFKLERRKLKEWYSQKRDLKPYRKFLWKLPVCYHIDFGIDLEEISGELGMTVEEIVALHTEQVYTVYGIGFLPGFMYLGGLPSNMETPRRPTPRLKVEKGAVGLAGRQTGIYPQESPGGWNIIGNCPIPIFNVEREEPCFVNVGDKIQFHPITKGQHDLYKIQAEVGIYKIDKIQLDA